MGRGVGYQFPIDDPAVYDDAHHVLFNPAVTLMGQCAYAAVLAVIYFLFRPVVPPVQMAVWGTMLAFVGTLVVLFDLAYVLRRPGRDELMRVWRPLDKRLPLVFDILALGALILLFPHAGPDLRGLSIAFFVGYVPLQMISDPENAAGNQTSIILVLGGFAVSLIVSGHGGSDLALAGMVVIYGGVLFVASQILRTGVLTAIAARQISEARAADLQRVLADLTAERDAKTRFIATAAHDLSQPLIAARLFASQLGHGADGPRISGLRAALDSVNDMLAQMSQALRLQADAVRPNIAPCAGQDILDNLQRTYHGLAAAAGIDLRIRPTARLIVTDRALLERALGNLVVNAIRHAGGRRVLVGFRAAPPGWVRVVVCDDGRGIAIVDRDRLFQDYFQTADPDRRGSEGFGLGLASARRLARLLGGNLTLRQGGGACFLLETGPVASGGGRVP